MFKQAKPTDQQINNLVLIIESELPRVYKLIGKNNEKYPDTKYNYRRQIWKEVLMERLTRVEAGKFRSILLKSRIDIKVEQFLTKKNIID